MKIGAYAIEVLKSIPLGFVIIAVLVYFKPYSLIMLFILFFIFLSIAIYIHILLRDYEEIEAILPKMLSYFPVIFFLDKIIFYYL